MTVSKTCRATPARALAEISSPTNDCNLNIRRYVDNSPPPEPHDVRAHLLGGVPVAEVERSERCSSRSASTHSRVRRARRTTTLFRFRAFAHRPLHDPSARRERSGVQARVQSLRDALAAWWSAHAARSLISPPARSKRRPRGVPRFFRSRAFAIWNVLDRFKLAGVIATWWTETLPDSKTLLENGFPGVIDGWVDAIADAVNDDEAAGPTFDPFAHKLVRR